MGFQQNLGLSELFDERTTLLREMGAAKGRLGQIEERIAELVKAPMDSAFKREGQPAGTVHFLVGNYQVKAVVDKRVTWDSAALAAIASKLSPDAVAVLFKVEYSVPEAAFKTIIEPDLKAKLLAARTVKYGAPKITPDDAA